MARPSKHDGVVYRRGDSKVWWMRYRDSLGQPPLGINQHRRLAGGATRTARAASRQRRSTRWRSSERASNLRFREWAEFFMENYSKPPIRAAKTHEANERAMKHSEG